MKKILFSAALFCVVTFVACGGDKGGVRMGSLSGDFDSLSYAFGTNVAYGINFQMKDIPFDFNRMAEGIEQGAMGKATMDHEKAMKMLQDYFGVKHGPRAQALAQKRAAADSVRMAAGDSTKMDYPADSSMFATPGERDSVSYAFGVDIGNNMKDGGLPLQIVWFTKGMEDVREGSAKMTQDQANNYLQYYFMVKIPNENAAASAKWLEKIEKKSGVKKTASGLLYKIEKAGDPNIIAKNDRDQVLVHYIGKNREGKVFDASRFADMPKEKQDFLKKNYPKDYKKDEAQPFELDGVMPGWTEGMKLVGKGGKIKLWIPSDLAYGMRGSGRQIGPNDALYFEVEVVDVIPYMEPIPAPAADSLKTQAPAAPEVKK